MSEQNYEIRTDAEPKDFPVGGPTGGGRKPQYPVRDLGVGQNLVVHLKTDPNAEGHVKEKERIRGALNSQYTRIREAHPERRFITRYDPQENAIRCFRVEDFTAEELAEERRKREERRRKREEKKAQLQALEEETQDGGEEEDEADLEMEE